MANILSRWIDWYLNFSGIRLSLDGGGASSTPTSTTTTSNSLPAYAQPYMESTLGRVASMTDINQNPYQSYGGQQYAGDSPLQKQGFDALSGMNAPQQTADASRMMTDMYNKSQQNQYQAPAYQSMGLGSLNVNAPQLSNISSNAAQSTFNPSLQNINATAAQGNFDPRLRDINAQAAQNTVGSGNLTNYQMTGPRDIGTDRFTDANNASNYMDPYMKNVVDFQQKEAQRASDIQKNQLDSQATAAGAFGGSRGALMQSERLRNLATQQGGIAATGASNAYQAAQQAYQTDAARALQAQQANQQAGLTTGTQNLGANLQTQALGTNTGLQAALANQNASQQANLANQQAGLGVQALGANIGSQFGLQNLSNQQQTGLANQQAGLNVQSLGANLGQQQALQNAAQQQATNLANQQAGLGVQALGAGQNLQAQQANQQAGLTQQQQALAQNQAMNSQNMANAQNAAQYGLAGINAGMGAASQLGNLGAQQIGQQMGIANAQLTAGGQQQANFQKQLDAQYQDWQNNLNYPYKQAQFMQSMLQNQPTNTTNSVYQAPPNLMSQLAGLGLGGFSLGKLTGFI